MVTIGNNLFSYNIKINIISYYLRISAKTNTVSYKIVACVNNIYDDTINNIVVITVKYIYSMKLQFKFSIL